MIQDIAPKELHNEFYVKNPSAQSKICMFKEDKLFCREENGMLRLPLYIEVKEQIKSTIYLFSIDRQEYYLADGESLDGYELRKQEYFRKAHPKEEVFACLTSFQLFRWYRENRYCGTCGTPLQHDSKERMMQCPNCHFMSYPKISPCIIVGITDGNRILMTKYRGRVYKEYSLVAGYVEIGETLEQTVMREVMEEVGLKVKNIQYYGNQPWAMSSTLLCGFFAEVDGDTTVTLEEEELAESRWFEREEITLEADDFSLTREMIMEFKEGKIEKGKEGI